MALKDLIHILYNVVFLALLPDMVRASQPPYDPDISWIILFLCVLGGIAVLVVFVIGVYFCFNKCSLNPTPGIVVTATGNDKRTIVTSGNTAQEYLPIEQYPNTENWQHGFLEHSLTHFAQPRQPDRVPWDQPRQENIII